MDEPYKILFIEDSQPAVSMMRKALAESEDTLFELESAETLSQGFERLRARDVDLILLDLSLPDSSGFDTFEKTLAEAPDVPIVVLTGNDDETTAVKSVQAGAQDYLVKGHVSTASLIRVIRYGIVRKRSEQERLRRKKLEGILEMARVTCHELNQPMQAIFGRFEILLLQMPDDDPLCEQLRAVKKQVDRMAEITRKLNGITRYESLNYIEGVKTIDIDKASRNSEQKISGVSV